jgi:ABC-2 type transport system permease protein
MSTIAIPGAIGAADQQRLPFVHQVSMLTLRNLRVLFRAPLSVLPGVFISIFTLFIYEASLGGASNFLPGLVGKSYLGFILPLCIVTSALSGAGLAGQAIVRDIASGYFNKLLLAPISRVALVLAAVLSGGVLLTIQSTVVLLVGVFMGLQSATGLLGMLAVVGFSALTGIALCGFSVGIALRSGDAGATEGASFLFFPFSFLTASFVPLELLGGWLRTAAEVNPVTYILNATRALLLDGWKPEIITQGLVSCLLLASVTFTFAFFGLRARARMK